MMPIQLQETEYSCGPASLYMLLFAYGIDLGMSEEEIGYLCKTCKQGTYVSEMNKFLKLIDLNLEKISLNEARFQLANNIPLLVSAMSSPKGYHLAIATKLVPYRRDHIVYLNDPYFGRDWTYSLDAFRILKPIFWRLK